MISRVDENRRIQTEQRDYGHQGEVEVLEWLKKKRYPKNNLYLIGGRTEQLFLGDIKMVNQSGGTTYFDVKTERRWTGNIVIEEWSDYLIRPGWPYHLKPEVQILWRFEPVYFILEFNIGDMIDYLRDNIGHSIVPQSKYEGQNNRPSLRKVSIRKILQTEIGKAWFFPSGTETIEQQYTKWKDACNQLRQQA